MALSEISVGDQNGSVYRTTESTETTVSVTTPPDSVVGDGQPTDTDGDGTYEDVNGDGSLDAVDVQALFTNRESATVRENSAAFDINGDGTVDVVDVQRLFSTATS
nr:dockerin type I domain-containing protein [Halarchaeum solikamskense]